jgi:hypothetical protein
MDNNSFQTSFIPKKPIASSNTSVVRGPTNFFAIFSIFVLIIMGAISGGLYLYKGYLQQQKDSLATSIVKGRDSFDKDTIDELSLFDKRSKASKQILNNHVVISPMFELLGNLTIPSIQYTKFSQKTTSGTFSVQMSGSASDYKSIALQADIFNTAKGRFFKNVVFSNLTKDKRNFVLFDLAFDVDPSLLSYENNILLNGQNVSSANTTPSTNSPNTNLNTNPQ